MAISARNGIKGTVESVKLGKVMASIKIKVEDPALITAVITKESAEDLDLAVGDDVSAIIKSTQVMVAK
ncbi:molybdenum-pterin binding protein Mop1 [Methanobrevibacter ruminantium M1]|uniref:Molybdenum-pterin binding protein Mop1 n=1 Tax=Methanobrevibacter ruminantium (strain ATCC 35063 / DSM 1093 / JCM 13430 / OCM 146 / M1) TaxID=634498 RepID=D3E3K8_METRM|nr:TOBE domain-containing protein [Methanobrevibacter ruminantium]ADC47119.1 molybdenum-pterin binding protein Mop1 [Methanobrevibacter ruminantium M1]